MPELPAAFATALADRYRIERELGQGGMATVYLAHDVRHDRKVALKVLRPELAAILGGERFLAEIKTTANLQHPHILSLFDSGEAEGLLYYVMPYVEGESLRDRLNREKQLPLDDALQTAREVAEALGHAHARRVIHRDIKPENILLESGHAVVADFGIAKAITAAGGTSLTETGMVIGTPGYMSPEQSLGEAVDGRSDIYALGCVLYEMLAGEPPYTGPSAQAIIAKRLSQPLPQLRTVRESVPPGIEAAVRRALARVPADRFATAEQFRAALHPAGSGPRWVEQPSGPLRVLGLYALASAALLGAVQVTSSWMVLPRWVVPGAGALLLIGLPIVMISMLVQRGALRPPTSLARLFAWRRTLLGGVIALAAWGIAVTAYMLLGSRSQADSAASGTAIAVLPFELTGLDSTIWQWGAANLLSANLDGIGTLRRVDSRTLESRWRVRPAHSSTGPVQDGIDVARKLGARYVLVPSMVNAGGSLRITADLYDAQSGRQLGPSVQVAGSADSIPVLLDRLSIEILRGTPLVSEVVQVPQVSLARVFSSSLEAMKAYLVGDELYRRSRWQEAIGQFNRAIELDSTFASAWFRLALAQGWLLHTGERLEYARRAVHFSDRLPAREQLLVRGLEALASGDPHSIVTLQEYTRRYPDDVEGWTLLGHAYFYYNGLRLEPLDQFRSALARAVELSPYFGPAYVDLLTDAFHRGDSATLRRLLPGYRRIDSQSDFCLGFELAYALAFGDSAQYRWAIGAIDTLGAAPFQPVACSAFNLLSSPDYEQPLQVVLRSMARPTRTPDARAFGEWIRAGDLVQHGRIRQAQAILDAKSQPDEGIYPLAMRVMLGVTHYADSDAVQRVGRALQDSPHRQVPFWTGVLAVAGAQTGRIRQAALQLRERARVLESAGDSLGASGNRTAAVALELYAELRRAPRETTVRQIMELLPGLGWSDNVLPSRLLRYEVGRALLGLGRAAEAQRVFEGFNYEDLSGEYAAPVEYYLGRVAEEQGSSEARVHYQRFVRWWERADPELQPWRQDARDRLARMTMEPQAPR